MFKRIRIRSYELGLVFHEDEFRGLLHFVRRPMKPKWFNDFLTRRFRRAGFGTLSHSGSLDQILALLEAHGQRWIHIPFDPEAYRRIGWDTGCLPDPGYPRSRAFRRLDSEVRQRLRLAERRLKINYVMNRSWQ